MTGIAVIAALALVSFVAARSPNGLPLVHYRTYYVSVPDPGNLQPHNEVRIHGVRVGQALKARFQGGRAVLEVKLNSGTPALPVDTRPVVRARGLLGQRYLELVPGSSSETLADGASIVGGPRSLSYGVPDALQTFDAETRGALGGMVRGLAAGLLGRGDDLNNALRVAPPAGRRFGRIFEDLDRGGAVPRLVPSMRLSSTAFDSARDDIAAGFGDASNALQPVVDRREELQATLAEAPPTLRVAQPALQDSRRLLVAARELSAAAGDVLPAAPRGLRATTALLRESAGPLHRAAALLADAETAVPATLSITRSAAPVLRPLRQALDDLLPLISVGADNGCAIDNFAENWRSALGFGTPATDGGVRLPSGRIGGKGAFRITAVAGTAALQGGSTAPANDRANPYPEPCEFSPGRAFIGNALGDPGGAR